MGQTVSHPIAIDRHVPMAATWASTTRLPNRSAKRPIDTDASAPMRCMDATRYAPNWAVSPKLFPEIARTAAKKEGVHDHMPSNSQQWNVYPAIKRRALRLRSRIVFIPMRSIRGWMLLGVFLKAYPDKLRPTRGRHPVTMKAVRYPPQVRHSPDTTNENAYPTEVLAIRYPTAAPRRDAS